MRTELIDNPKNPIGYFPKKFAYGRVPYDFGFGKYYIVGKIKIAIRMRSTINKADEYIALFQQSRGISIGDPIEGKVENCTSSGWQTGCSSLSDPDPCGCDFLGNYKQKPVFVEVVDLGDGKEHVVQSIVRLHKLDKSLGFRSDASYFFCSLTRLKMLSVLADWQSSRSVWPAAASLNKLPYQMIQSGPEVVGDISSDQLDGNRDRPVVFDPIDYVSCFRIRITRKQLSTRVVLDERRHFPFEIHDVLVGPFDFGQNANKPD